MQALQMWMERIGNVVWGPLMIAALLGLGVGLTVQTRFLQFRHMRLWLHQTVGQLLYAKTTDGTGVTRVQALTTALAGTMGTGNIVGVATALSLGGAGAVFWMWVSALVGMMLKYAEVLLAVKYRRRDAEGQWIGGTIEVMEYGLRKPRLASIFAVCCMFASFGMGNMAQSNAIAQAAQNAFGMALPVSGVLCAVLLAAVIFGGIRRIARVAEALIPLLSLAYGVGCLAVIGAHVTQLLPTLQRIVQEAFAASAVVGGAAGSGIAAAMRHGISSGIFSNEAGLGSSGMAYAAAGDAQPVPQGLWGIFEVFFDTIVVCTLTALTILTAGVPIGQQFGAALPIAAFETLFGAWGGGFVAVAVILFAFASMLGWAYYGERSFIKLGGTARAYRLLFVAAAYIGSVMQLKLVWGLSEIFNGFMAIPNLIALVLLAPVVCRETSVWLGERAALPPHRK